MIFTFGEARRLHATLDDESGCAIYACTYSVCTNPVCTCGTIDLDLVPLEGTTPGKKRVIIDLLNRNVASSEAEALSESDRAFSEKLVARLDDFDFTLLSLLFMEKKHALSDECPIDTIDHPFNFEDIQALGNLVPYTDVFPYARNYEFDMAGSRWVGFDEYCLQTSCRCSQVLFQVYPVELDELDPDDAFFFQVDYKKNRWTWLDNEDNCPSPLEEVRDVLTSTFPDLYRLLALRHKRMRDIYTRCYKKHRAASSSHAKIERLLSDELKGSPDEAPITVTKKTGRNEPCPCGSGKKYKKCCMP